MIRKFAMSVAALAVGVSAVAVSTPANAEEGKATKPGVAVVLRDTGFGGCQKPGQAWGKDGAFSALTIDDSVKWNSKTSLTVVRSYADAVNTGCLNGYAYNGGTKRLISGWTVTGQGVSSCSIGLGGNCTISDTKASDGYDTGNLKNNDGIVSTQSGGGSVYATGTVGGRINNYTHSANARFSLGGVTTSANSSNFVTRGF